MFDLFLSINSKYFNVDFAFINFFTNIGTKLSMCEIWSKIHVIITGKMK